MNHEVQRSSCLTMLHNKNRKRSVKKGRDMNALNVACFSALIWKEWASNEWNCTRQHLSCFRCILWSVMILKQRRFCLALVLRITHQIPCCKIIKNIFICHSKSYEFSERRKKSLLWSVVKQWLQTQNQVFIYFCSWLLSLKQVFLRSIRFIVLIMCRAVLLGKLQKETKEENIVGFISFFLCKEHSLRTLLRDYNGLVGGLFFVFFSLTQIQDVLIWQHE